MALEMVLNELSSQIPADNVEIAKQWMSDLILTIQSATTSGVERVLRTQDDFNNVLLAPDYPVFSWRTDPAVKRENREAQQYFRTLVTKFGFLADVTDDQITDKNGRSEFFCQGGKAVGLGSAHLLGALAISINSSVWKDDRLQLNVRELDNRCEIVDRPSVEVAHASCRKHVQNHRIWIAKRLIYDGLSLWDYREKLFPYLPFCLAVEKQLQQIYSGSPMLTHVIEQLLKLDLYGKNWHTGPFDYREIACKISSESATTLQKYGEERTFLCPDGITRTFRWHAKLANGWRIYFEPWVNPLVNERRRLVIGYIGSHPSNVTDP